MQGVVSGKRRRRFAAIALAVAVTAGEFLAAAPAAEPQPEDPVYLFTSFRGNGEAGLQFLASEDGLAWEEIPGKFLKPRAGGGQLMRDPSLARGPDGIYRLVWTTAWRGDRGFGYASSKDLVHWSEQRFLPVMEHEPTTVNVWAPELFYDAAGEQWILCWASTIPGRFPDNGEPPDNNQRMYFTTTKDFQTFAATKLLFDPGFNVIDASIVKDGERYQLVVKDNSRPVMKLRVAQGPSPTGPWSNVSEPFTPQFTEGPTVLRRDDDWLIYFDEYRAERYGAVRTRDWTSFADATSDVKFPRGHKHGTVLTVTRAEVDYLKKVGPQQMPGLRLPWTAPLTAEQVANRLAEIDRVAARGPFQPNWDSIGQFKPPSWYRDGKFGLFIHWGAYSVPAFGSEWYPRNMYKQDQPEYAHHLATYGSPAEFGYKEFIERFQAEKFDPAAWAKLFHEAGARYVVPVAEHHDGFPMYDSDLTEWCAAKKGPRRDVVGELHAEFRKVGIVPGASSHRAEHWWFFDHGMRYDTDVRRGEHAALYGPAANQRVAENQAEPPDQAFLDDWLLRSCEIVDKYRPQLMYFDWWICQPVFQPYLKRFAAYYYNRGAEWGVDVAINFKEWEGRSFPDGCGVFDIERGQSAEIRPDFWQTDTSVSNNSWGYVREQQYRTADSIVDDLVDIVSKNGALLLNIGPKPDGTIADAEQALLREVGQWLKINGEAIYSSRPWRVFGEGPTQIVAGSFADVKREPFTAADFRFTTRDGALYAIALAWPADGVLRVKLLAAGSPHAGGKIDSVSLVGGSGQVEWEQTAEALIVRLPATAPHAPSELAVALKIVGAGLVDAGADAASASAPDPAEAEYARVIDQRAEKIVAVLDLDDAARRTRVRDAIATWYRTLRDLHAERDAGDAAAKAAVEARIVAAHRTFVARLGAMLSPDQVDAVKDGLTYGVVPLTFHRYRQLLPQLAPEQVETIRSHLLEAREYAMDAGSADEKHAWFGKYKGRVNNYVSSLGIDMKEAERRLAEREKETGVAKP